MESVGGAAQRQCWGLNGNCRLWAHDGTVRGGFFLKALESFEGMDLLEEVGTGIESF